jgi:hypothetical protein
VVEQGSVKIGEDDVHHSFQHKGIRQ